VAGTRSSAIGKGIDWIVRKPNRNLIVRVFANRKVLYDSFETRRAAEAARHEISGTFPNEAPWLRRFQGIKSEIRGMQTISDPVGPIGKAAVGWWGVETDELQGTVCVRRAAVNKDQRALEYLAYAYGAGH
jgi:hypothetical protein